MDTRPTYEDLLKQNQQLLAENKTLRSRIIDDDLPANFKLTDLIDITELQSLMKYFYNLVGLGIGILDTDNNVLVAEGWQDICLKYHRVHPLTCERCKQSDDLFFSSEQNGIIEKKCQNGLWDTGSPVIVAGKRLASVMFGQFFYDDEEIDEQFFIKQAEQFGFDKEEYLADLRKVPVISRRKVNNLISFYEKLADIIANLGYQNLVNKKYHQQEKAAVKKKLDDQKILLDKIIENLPVGLQIFDSDGVSRRMNEKQKELLGLPDTNEGIGIFNVFTDPYCIATGSDERFKQVLESKHVLTHEFEYNPGVSENKWNTRQDKRVFRESIFPIVDTEGEVTNLISLLVDMTENVKFEHKLIESEQKYRSLFFSAGDAAFVMNKNHFIDCNHRAEEMFEADRDSLIGIPPWEISPEYQPDGKKSREKTYEKIESVLQGNMQSFEWLHKTIKGSTFYTEVTLNLVDEEKGTIIAFVRDVTERKKIGKELERVRTLLDENEKLSSTGAWEYNVKQDFIYWSDGLYDLHEMDRNDDIDHVAESIKCYLPEDRDKILAAFNECLAEGVEYDLEFPFVTYKNNNKWIRTRTRPIYEEDRIVRIIGSVKDITHHKKIEEELRELNAAKDKFFSIIAHDLRSPYVSLLGFTEVIYQNAVHQYFEDMEKHSQILLKTAKRNLDLLDNLLQWGRLQTKHVKFNPMEIDLEETVVNLSNVYISGIKEKKITLAVKINPGFMVFADKYMLETILRNLISNSIKYTKKNCYIEISAIDKEDKTFISVKDNGVGIDKKTLPLLFSIDGNISTPGTNDEKGTGLGLILCKEFVEQHGGKLSVKSEPNVETVFSFTLPSSEE